MYEPSDDSYLLKKVIEDYCSKNKVLNAIDVGTGSGIQAFAMAEKVGFVLAVDINKESCKFVRDSIIEKGFSSKMETLCSDLFSNVPHRLLKNADLIVFNAPYLPPDDEDEDTELSGGAHGIHVTKEFLMQAKEFLSEKGVIFFVASSLAKLELLEKFMLDNEYKFEVVSKKHISFEDIIVYKAWL